jgi:hypothetical protein
MSDEVLREVWRAKDAIARKHNYDVRSLGAELMRQQQEEQRQEGVRKIPPAGQRKAHSRGSRT